MRYDPLRSDVLRDSHAPERAELSGITIILVLACAALVACPALVALTRGWDYALAVMLGAILAATLARVAWRAFAADRVADRLAVALAGTLAAALFCAYAADWLDWRPLGIDDAVAGMTIGVILLVAGPVRQGLRYATDVPNAGCVALVALALAPAAWTLFVLEFQSDALERGVRYALILLPGCGAGLLIAVSAFVLALRRGRYWTAFTLSALAGLEVFLLGDDRGAWIVTAALFGGIGAASRSLVTAALFGGSGGASLSLATAAWLGGTAGAGLSLIAAYAWAKSARKSPRTPGYLFAWLAIATAVALAAGAAVLAYFTAAAGLTVWWLSSHRRGAPLVIPASFKPADVLRTALAGAVGLTLFAYFLLLQAAALNLTGPMVLAELRERGLYTVSDFTFSGALLADQYLWRDSASSSRRVTATSPEQLVEASRYEKDQWSGVDLAARQYVREARSVKGHGIVLGPRVAEGLAIAYVYEGSPAHAAGVRRGQVIRAINGIPIADHDDSSGASVPRSDVIRLELAPPGGEVREVALTRGGYTRPAVSVEKVIDQGGRRVGYVVLRDFLGAADEEFVGAVVRLHIQGIDELVLDLRMNPGGRLYAARRIASVIGGPRLNGRTFVRLAHNERHRDRDRDLVFSSWRELSLRRVFVITSADACSASEALINGLAPHMSVVTVGTPTCGKPVGSSTLEYGDFTYSVITFRALNARGEGDYYAGLRPTCAAEDDFAHELGDPEEASLQAALHYVRHGRCPEPSAMPL